MGLVLVVLQGQVIYESLVTLGTGKTCPGHPPKGLVHGVLVFLQTVQLVKPFFTPRDGALKEEPLFQQQQKGLVKNKSKSLR